MIYFESCLEKPLSKYLYVFKPNEIHFGLEYVSLSHPQAIWVVTESCDQIEDIKSLGEEIITVSLVDNELDEESISKILNLKSLSKRTDMNIEFKESKIVNEQVIVHVEKEVIKPYFSGSINLNHPITFARMGIPSIELVKFARGNLSKHSKYCIIDLDILPTFAAKHSGQSLNEVNSIANAKDFKDIEPIVLEDNILYFFGTTESSKMDALLKEDWYEITKTLNEKFNLDNYKVIVLMQLESSFIEIYKAFARAGKGYILTQDINFIKEIAMKTSRVWESSTVLIDLPLEKLELFRKSMQFNIMPLKSGDDYVIV